jgi:flagellar L-ring protein precursor FlgH
MSTRTSKRLLAAAVAGAAVAALLAPTGASAARKPKPSEFDASFAPAPAPRAANGAIFQAEGGYASLVEGGRAARVGDLLTILLVESTSASKQNSAAFDRNGNIGLTPPTSGPLSFFSSSDTSFGGGSSFKGDGKAQQSNKLSGEVTVTVAQVYPNGTMLVKGQKLLTLNRGDEFVQIAGLVRPADISADNRVLSTRVADARITYSGKGEIARASRQGWLGRFFSRISPF